MCRKAILVAVAVALSALTGNEAPAIDEQTSTVPPEGEETDSPTTDGMARDMTPESDSLGLNLSLELASAYSFRGINVFQADSQHDVHARLSPSVTWSVGDTGVWFNTWGAFQLNGPNRRDLVLEGLGREFDLSVGYDHECLDGAVVLSAAFTGYLYPFADAEVAGTGTPTWLEPMAGVTWEMFASLGLTITYMTHLQPVLAGWDYLYVNPTASLSLPLDDRMALEPGLSAGWKVWVDGPAWQDNTADVTVDLNAPATVGPATVTAGAHVTWTNLEDTSLVDEAFVWGSIAAAVDW